MSIDCGWDIGGVHLKVACLRSGSGGAPRLAFRQEAFEIWRAPGRLASRLSAMLDEVLARQGADAGAPHAAARHAVTMTAELSDVFPDRRSGIQAILAACVEAFGAAAAPIRVLGTRGELLTLSEAAEAPRRVAAANWSASARLAARLAPTAALFIDVGSTTTDIIPIEDGRAIPEGLTDLERLRSGELVYAGLLRTPPSALAERVPLGDSWCRVAPEAFAIMGDVYLLLGRIEAGQYTVPTPDGRGLTREECAARLARLVCAEPRELGSEQLHALASYLEERHVERIADGIRQVLSRGRGAERFAVVAGAGWSLAEAACRAAGMRAVRLGHLLPSLGAGWDLLAPAAALALLLAEERGARDLIPQAPA